MQIVNYEAELIIILYISKTACAGGYQMNCCFIFTSG